MTGCISYKGGIWDVGVDGLPGRRYMGYTKAEAVKQYRAEFRLVRRRIEWRDYTKPGMPQNLFDAVMAAARFGTAVAAKKTHAGLSARRAGRGST